MFNRTIAPVSLLGEYGPLAKVKAFKTLEFGP